MELNGFTQWDGPLSSLCGIQFIIHFLKGRYAIKPFDLRSKLESILVLKSFVYLVCPLRKYDAIINSFISIIQYD